MTWTIALLIVFFLPELWLLASLLFGRSRKHEGRVPTRGMVRQRS